jgi:hypothetical protein
VRHDGTDRAVGVGGDGMHGIAAAFQARAALHDALERRPRCRLRLELLQMYVTEANVHGRCRRAGAGVQADLSGELACRQFEIDRIDRQIAMIQLENERDVFERNLLRLY